MAIVVYPADGYNSFGTLADITTLVEIYTPNTYWADLDDNQKEGYLIQATMMIKQCSGITLPDDTTEDLKTAEAIIANYLTTVYNSDYDSSADNVTMERVGEIEQRFKDGTGKNDPTVIPPQAQIFLSQYGCNARSGGFSQSYVGRS